MSKAAEQAMKGQPRQQVAPLVRQAVRDVIFLFHVHQKVNHKLMEEDRHYWTKALLLSTELDALRRERALRDRMTWGWMQVGMELPYPLDPEAAAVEAVKEHYVVTWELLEEGDDVTGWVADSFIAQGSAEFPQDAYLLTEDVKARYTTDPTEDEVRALFEDTTEFQKFMAGEDYRYGLADVPDAEFEARYEAVCQTMKGLVVSGEVEAGVVVELPTVPRHLFQDARLVEGEWLDCYVVELAEWGARLQERGYQFQEPEDSHPMAWHRIVDPETGMEVDAGVLEKLWQQTRKNLGRFSGRTRDIQGRPYLRFPEYLRWRSRKAKGDFDPASRHGWLLSSWNRWVSQSGGAGTATLEGVKVDRLNSYLEGYRYHLCRAEHEAAEERRRRESLLDSLRCWKLGSRIYDRYHRRICDWGEMTGNFLCELYSLRQAADNISQRYLDGTQVPFPAVAEDFDRLTGCLEELVEGYNEDFTNESRQESVPAPEGLEAAKPRRFIDIAVLEQAVAPTARQHTAFLVDMAKAEALDALGENRAAVAIVDRHM